MVLLLQKYYKIHTCLPFKNSPFKWQKRGIFMRKNKIKTSTPKGLAMLAYNFAISKSKAYGRRLFLGCRIFTGAASSVAVFDFVAF